MFEKRFLLTNSKVQFFGIDKMLAMYLRDSFILQMWRDDSPEIDRMLEIGLLWNAPVAFYIFSGARFSLNYVRFPS
jgi:hypothetical protein